jgi:hypothetical protein
LPDGTWTSDCTILQDEAQKYFKTLFAGTQPHYNRTFTTGPLTTIDEAGKLSLTAPVTKGEVFAALNSMKPYKAPGPDGFQCIFFKQYWHIVGDDIFHLVQSAFQTGHFDSEISDTLIALIPKNDTPSTYKDFRPISLCNILFTKLLLKCWFIGLDRSSMILLAPSKVVFYLVGEHLTTLLFCRKLSIL